MSEPPAARAGLGVTAKLMLLGASLRAGGVRVGVGQVLSAHRALAAIDAADRRDSYLALRSVLCSRREDLEVFDAAFAEVFAEVFAGDAELPAQPEALDEVAALVLPSVAVPPQRRVPEPDTIQDGEVVPAAWSEVEMLRNKDFAAFTAADRQMARGLMRRLAARGPVRTSRRTRASHRRGPAGRGGCPWARGPFDARPACGDSSGPGRARPAGA